MVAETNPSMRTLPPVASITISSRTSSISAFVTQSEFSIVTFRALKSILPRVVETGAESVNNSSAMMLRSLAVASDALNIMFRPAASVIGKLDAATASKAMLSSSTTRSS